MTYQIILEASVYKLRILIALFRFIENIKFLKFEVLASFYFNSYSYQLKVVRMARIYIEISLISYNAHTR